MGETKNLYRNLQEIRVALQEVGLTKSGHNDYSNYDYFELSDFLPEVQKLTLEKGIIPIYELSENQAMLHICDLDNIEARITFSIPTADATVKGANAIQAIGSLTTYTRRYLYMIAFEIAENDDFDRTQIPDNIPVPSVADVDMDYIDNAKIKTIKSRIANKGLSEQSILEHYKLDDFYKMTFAMWSDAMKLMEQYPDKEEGQQ